MQISTLKRENTLIRSGVIVWFNFSFNPISPCHAVSSPVCRKKKENKTGHGLGKMHGEAMTFACPAVPPQAVSSAPAGR